MMDAQNTAYWNTVCAAYITAAQEREALLLIPL